MLYKFDPEVEQAMNPTMAMLAHAPPIVVHDIAARRRNFAFIEAIGSRQFSSLHSLKVI